MNKLQHPTSNIQHPKRGLLLATALLLIVAGCASFNATVFNAEKTAADTATAATHSFNLYYKTVGPTLDTNALAHLNSTRDAIYAADRKLSASLTVLDAARANYALNSAATNQTQVQLLLAAVGSQSTNLVALIRAFLAAPPPPTTTLPGK